MLSAKSRYKDVAAIMWKYEKCKEFEEDRISALLDQRNKELEKLDETLKNIVAFKEMLQCFEGINDKQQNHKFAKQSCRQLQLKNDRCNRVGDNFKYIQLIVIKGRINHKLLPFTFSQLQILFAITLSPI